MNEGNHPLVGMGGRDVHDRQTGRSSTDPVNTCGQSRRKDAVIEGLQLELIGKHDRTAFAFGPAEPGRLVQALGKPVLLARDHKRVVGTPLAPNPQGLGDQLPAVPPTPLGRYYVQLGQVHLLCRAPHRRLNPHHRNPDPRAGLMPAGEQDRDVVALNQSRQSGPKFVRRRRRLVVLHIEVVQQLCCGGDSVATRNPVYRLDHGHKFVSGDPSRPLEEPLAARTHHSGNLIKEP